MDAKYILGSTDLTRSTKASSATALPCAAVGDPERWHRLLDQIYEKMKFHFHAEESVMAILPIRKRRSIDVRTRKFSRIEARRQRTVDATEIEAAHGQPMQLFQEQIPRRTCASPRPHAQQGAAGDAVTSNQVTHKQRCQSLRYMYSRVSGSG